MPSIANALASTFVFFLNKHTKAKNSKEPPSWQKMKQEILFKCYLTKFNDVIHLNCDERIKRK